MVYNAEKPIITTSFHCIRCGAMWGCGIDINSSGVCPSCFIDWAITKRVCFGGYLDTADCVVCNFKYFCKEYYGIR